MSADSALTNPFVIGDLGLAEDLLEQPDADVSLMGVRDPNLQGLSDHERMSATRHRPLEAEFAEACDQVTP